MALETKTKQNDEHLLYRWGAAVAALVALVGFGRTFYLKAFFGTPTLTPLVHIHGLVMTLWVALYVVQTWLVASHRTHIHRRLGIFGALWACVVLIVGTTTGIVAAKLGHSPGPPPLVFLIIPLGDMVIFGVLVSVGLWLRNKRETHRRLMLLATLGILTAAFARIQLGFIQNHLPLAAFLLTDFTVLAFVAYDSFKHRRLHPAFAWGGLLILVSLPLRIWLSGTSAWMQFASWLVR